MPVDSWAELRLLGIRKHDGRTGGRGCVIEGERCEGKTKIIKCGICVRGKRKRKRKKVTEGRYVMRSQLEIIKNKNNVTQIIMKMVFFINKHYINKHYIIKII